MKHKHIVQMQIDQLKIGRFLIEPLPSLRVGKPYASADQQKGDQVLYFPYILFQNQRTEDASKHGLGKFDDKEL